MGGKNKTKPKRCLTWTNDVHCHELRSLIDSILFTWGPYLTSLPQEVTKLRNKGQSERVSDLSQTRSLYRLHHPYHLPPIPLLFLIFLKAPLVNHHCWMCLSPFAHLGPLFLGPLVHTLYTVLVLSVLTTVYGILCFYLYLPILGCPRGFRAHLGIFPAIHLTFLH